MKTKNVKYNFNVPGEVEGKKEIKTSDVAKWSDKKTVKQVITFAGGYKVTFKNIKSETIEQGKFTHFETEDGRLVLINPDNVFVIEVFK